MSMEEMIGAVMVELATVSSDVNAVRFVVLPTLWVMKHDINIFPLITAILHHYQPTPCTPLLYCLYCVLCDDPFIHS